MSRKPIVSRIIAFYSFILISTFYILSLPWQSGLEDKVYIRLNSPQSVRPGITILTKNLTMNEVLWSTVYPEFHGKFYQIPIFSG